MDNEAHINTARELKGSKFCHPGHGIQNHWTEVLADVSSWFRMYECEVQKLTVLRVFQYFETKLVPRECEEDISPTESRIKAVANFFGPSCKAGPWVSDPVEDRALSNSNDLSEVLIQGNNLNYIFQRTNIHRCASCVTTLTSVALVISIGVAEGLSIV